MPARTTLPRVIPNMSGVGVSNLAADFDPPQIRPMGAPSMEPMNTLQERSLSSVMPPETPQVQQAGQAMGPLTEPLNVPESKSGGKNWAAALAQLGMFGAAMFGAKTGRTGLLAAGTGMLQGTQQRYAQEEQERLRVEEKLERDRVRKMAQDEQLRREKREDVQALRGDASRAATVAQVEEVESRLQVANLSEEEKAGIQRVIDEARVRAERNENMAQFTQLVTAAGDDPTALNAAATAYESTFPELAGVLRMRASGEELKGHEREFATFFDRISRANDGATLKTLETSIDKLKLPDNLKVQLRSAVEGKQALVAEGLAEIRGQREINKVQNALGLMQTAIKTNMPEAAVEPVNKLLGTTFTAEDFKNKLTDAQLTEYGMALSKRLAEIQAASEGYVTNDMTRVAFTEAMRLANQLAQNPRAMENNPLTFSPKSFKLVESLIENTRQALGRGDTPEQIKAELQKMAIDGGLTIPAEWIDLILQQAQSAPSAPQAQKQVQPTPQTAPASTTVQPGSTRSRMQSILNPGAQ